MENSMFSNMFKYGNRFPERAKKLLREGSSIAIASDEASSFYDDIVEEFSKQTYDDYHWGYDYPVLQVMAYQSKPRVWKTRKGKAFFEQACYNIRRKAKNDGWIIEATHWQAAVWLDDKYFTGPVQIYQLDRNVHLFNETEKGVKEMGFDSKNNIIWGYSYVSDTVIDAVRREYYKLEDYTPIARYLEIEPSYQVPWYDNQDLKALRGYHNPRQVLNDAYRGTVPKDAFGGVHNLDTPKRLVIAKRMCEGLRAYNPSVFRDIVITGNETIGNQTPKAMRYTLNFFGNTKKAFRIFFDEEGKWKISESRVYVRGEDRPDMLGSLLDFVRMAKQVRSHKARNAIRDIHRRGENSINELDRLMGREAYLASNPDRKIDWPELHQYDGAKVNEHLTIRTPKSTQVLKDWGDEHRICISGYAETVLKHGSMIMAIVRKDGTKAGFMEVRGGEVHQLLGNMNRSLEATEKRPILDWAKEQGWPQASSIWA